MYNLLLPIVAALIINVRQEPGARPEPEAVSITEYFHIIPNSGMASYTWTCGERVATLQVSWTTSFEPGEARRRTGLEIAGMIAGRPLDEPAFTAFVQEASALEWLPSFHATCANERFALRAFTPDEEVVWYEGTR